MRQLKSRLHRQNLIRLLVLTLIVTTGVCLGRAQEVPVRLSFKFILNASGNRPAVGNINTDDEVNEQVAKCNAIFSQFISELRIENLEIVDVTNLPTFYTAEPTEANRDALRLLARTIPSLSGWRDDAVNYYINASTGTEGAAIADFPPDNNIVLVSQGAFQPTVAHELGHILSLMHTHESDSCSDTLPDDRDWTSIDQMAMNSFGVIYSSLDANQRARVDMTWTNLMSYHDPNNRCMLSPCQMDRQSTTTYDDKDWMLSKVPVYVEAGFIGPPTGSFTMPFPTIEMAILFGLNDKALVLQTGVHARPSSTLNSRTSVVTRKGTSTIQDMPVLWSLPCALEDSTNAGVRKSVLSAQECDRHKDSAGAIKHLITAEQQATGRERSALQLELAQRLRDARRFEEAANYFKKLAEDTAQEALRRHALKSAEEMSIHFGVQERKDRTDDNTHKQK